jgi:hypothetical protein
MSSEVYRENYLAALEVAHSQLDRIIREFDSLQLRKEQIEDVVGALDPFLSSAQPAGYEIRQPEPVRYESRRPEPIQVEPVWTAPATEVIPPVLRATPVPAPEPVAPAAFAPMSESKIDPIQSRINRALGLAVA